MKLDYGARSKARRRFKRCELTSFHVEIVDGDTQAANADVVCAIRTTA